MLKALEQHERHQAENSLFGFWVYLMTDLIMFAALFAAFAALRNNTAGGPGGQQLFDLPFVLGETFILLFSSFSVGLANLAAIGGELRKTLAWLWLTLVLGGSFLIMELWEFHKLITEGHGPQRSAFLSSYFSLVGTHGAHIAAGLLWLAVMMLVIYRRGLSGKTKSQLERLALFWHFLDLVWIFIFTIVYLLGVI